MGLDNAIQVRRNKYSNEVVALKQFEEDWDKEHKYDFEVCYWRKCWNVRSDIMSLTSAPYDGGGGHFEVTTDELKKICKLLKSYNKDSWGESSYGSIWSWEEHKKINAKHIKNLKKLIKLTQKYPELEVYFVDSY